MVESCAVLTVKLKKIVVMFLVVFGKYGLHSQVISRSFLLMLWSERPLIISFCLICLTGPCQWRPHVWCKHLLDTDCVIVVLSVTGSDNDRQTANSDLGFFSFVSDRCRNSTWKWVVSFQFLQRSISYIITIFHFVLLPVSLAYNETPLKRHRFILHLVYSVRCFVVTIITPLAAAHNYC